MLWPQVHRKEKVGDGRAWELSLPMKCAATWCSLVGKVHGEYTCKCIWDQESVWFDRKVDFLWVKPLLNWKKISSCILERSYCQDEDFFHIYGEEFALCVLAMQSYNESLLLKCGHLYMRLSRWMRQVHEVQPAWFYAKWRCIKEMRHDFKKSSKIMRNSWCPGKHL